MLKYFLILSMIAIGSFGQIVLKLESDKLVPAVSSINSIKNLFPTVISLIKNYRILSVIILYGISFFIWLFLLKNYDLSYIFPVVTAIIFISVLLLSAFILKENITATRIIGIALIIAGVLFINYNKN